MAVGAAAWVEADRLDGAGLEVPASDDVLRAAGVALGVRRAGDLAGEAEDRNVRMPAGVALLLAADEARAWTLGFAVAPRGAADDFVARAELAAEEARLLDAAAGFAGRRTDAVAERGLRAAVLVVPWAPAAARDGVLAAGGREPAFGALVLWLLAAGAARRADAAAGFLVCLAGVAVARAPRAVTLPVVLLAAAARGAGLRRLAAGAAFLAPAADVGFRSGFSGRARRAGVLTAALRTAGAFDAAALPTRDGAAVLALPRVAVAALRALRAGAEADAAFRPAVAALVRGVDADERRPAEAAPERVLPGGALLPGRLAMVTSERSGRLASNRPAYCALSSAVQPALFEQGSC